MNDSPGRGIKPPASARLAEVRVPVLAIVGERDLPDFQRIADMLATEIPSARKVVMHGVGHMSNMENPAEFNAIVLDFLATIDGATLSG